MKEKRNLSYMKNSELEETKKELEKLKQLRDNYLNSNESTALDVSDVTLELKNGNKFTYKVPTAILIHQIGLTIKTVEAKILKAEKRNRKK